MNRLERSFNQNQAIQSLLQLENIGNSIQSSDNWNVLSKKQTKLNINFLPLNINLPKKVSYLKTQIISNFLSKQKLISKNKMRRAKSFFDPVKTFKINSTEVTSEQSSQKQLEKLQQNKKIKNPKSFQYIQYPSYISGCQKRSSKLSKNHSQSSDLNRELKQQSFKEDVIIQVQSYQQSFNRKQMEYYLSKTSARRKLKYELDLQKKQNIFEKSVSSIKYQKLQNKNQNRAQKLLQNKNKFKITQKPNSKQLIKKQISKINNFKCSQYIARVQKLNTKYRKIDLSKSLRVLLRYINIIPTDQQYKDRIKITKCIFNLGNKNKKQSQVYKENISTKYNCEEFQTQKQFRATKKPFQQLQLLEFQFRQNSPISAPHIKKMDTKKMSSITPRKYYRHPIKKYNDQNQPKIFYIKKLA